MLRRYISANEQLDCQFASLFSPRHFQCFYLYTLLGATAEQAGKIMGITSGTTEQYIHHCKTVLISEGMDKLSSFEIWREMYRRKVIKQYVTNKSACLTSNFYDIRSPEQKKRDPKPFILSHCLHPDKSLNGAMASMMTRVQQESGYLFMIGATYDEIGELMGFSRSAAVGNIKRVREGLERFGMLKASRLIAWLFFFGHNYVRQEVHPDSPLLQFNYNDIREGLGMRREYFLNW